MKSKLLCLLWMCLISTFAFAQNEEIKIPENVKAFVETETKAIALENGDLNGDGKTDYVLVLERLKPQKDKDDFPTNQRPLLILIAQADDSLKLVKRNEKIVMCSECGGVMGDPFQGVTIEKNTFTVSHYGGSAWRWGYDYKFGYSRRDNTWQLVKVHEITFNSGDPEKTTKEKNLIPPKDYGKIDIADFDPENYKGKGEK